MTTGPEIPFSTAPVDWSEITENPGNYANRIVSEHIMKQIKDRNCFSWEPLIAQLIVDIRILRDVIINQKQGSSWSDDK